MGELKKIPGSVVEGVRKKTSESSDKFLRLSIPLTNGNRDTILRILRNTGADGIGSVITQDELIIGAEISIVLAFTERIKDVLKREGVDPSLSSIPPPLPDAMIV